MTAPLMKSPYFERLTALVAFLARLSPRNFDMRSVVAITNPVKSSGVCTRDLPKAISKPREDCGSAACVYGWLPAVFPEDFSWDDRSVLFQGELKPFARAGREWLGISHMFFFADAYPYASRCSNEQHHNVLTALRGVLRGELSPYSSQDDVHQYVTEKEKSRVTDATVFIGPPHDSRGTTDDASGAGSGESDGGHPVVGSGPNG